MLSRIAEPARRPAAGSIGAPSAGLPGSDAPTIDPGAVDRAYLIETGRVVLSGSAQDVKNDDAVRASYLGY